MLVKMMYGVIGLMQNKKILVIKGTGGLGNRLRTLASAIQYAKTSDRAIYVDWRDGVYAKEGENAFDRYFELDGVERVENIDWTKEKSFFPSIYSVIPPEEPLVKYFSEKLTPNRYVRKIVDATLDILQRRMPISDKFDNVLCNASIRIKSYVLRDEYKKLWNKPENFPIGSHLARNISEDVVVYADGAPQYSAKLMQNCIHLQGWIQKKVDDFVAVNRINEKSVGIHIRGEGKKCIGDIERSIKKLRKFVDTHDVNKLYVCTDNADIEKMFVEEFGEMVIMQKKQLPQLEEGETGIHAHAWHSKESELIDMMAEEAIIDMFALAQTTYLFWHAGSTFSEISKVYHHNRKNVKPWNLL